MTNGDHAVMIEARAAMLVLAVARGHTDIALKCLKSIERHGTLLREQLEHPNHVIISKEVTL